MKEKLFVVMLLVMVGVFAFGAHSLDAQTQDQGASSTSLLAFVPRLRAAESPVAPEIQAGLDASSARWAALGDYYLARFKAAVDADTRRYQALVDWYVEEGYEIPNPDPLLAARKATEDYFDVRTAEKEGFVPLFDCIDKPGDVAAGAMGVHYIQPSRFDDHLDLEEPEVLVYEPQANGHMRLVAVEYIIPAAVWSQEESPEFLGQELKYKTTMGKYGKEDGIDPYFEVHAWVWKHNPSGLFADWNPNVTCSN